MRGGYFYKLLAPVIITGLLVLASAACFWVYAARQDESLVTLTAALLCGGFAGVSCYVLFERVKEIESGEEDDLGKY